MGRSYQQFAEEAKSKSQQRLMGMVRAAQKGEMDNPSEQVKKLARTMKKKDVKDFASTKHDDLPEKKKLDEVLGGKPGDGYIGHPNLDIKNPLHKGPRKKAETGGTGISHRLGDKVIRLDNSRKEEFSVSESAWQRKEGKNPSGGLNEKGRKSYERENPGSDLKAPQPEGGPRKRSFCARMGGMKGPMKDEKGRPTRKALALRKWKC